MFSPKTTEDDEVISLFIDTTHIPQGIINNMQYLAENLSSEDLAGVSPSGEKTQYTTTRPGIKRKGGTPPKDYSLVESLIDLQMALKNEDYQGALTSYYFLKRHF